MNCEQFDTHVTAYIDGMLPKETRALMDAHRKDCEVCARLACAHEMVLSGLNATGTVKAPASLRERILAAAAKEPLPENVVGFPWGEVLTQLGAAAALIFGGYVSLRGDILRSLTVFEGLKASVTGFGGYSAALYERGGVVLTEGMRLLTEPLVLPFVTHSIPLYYLAGLAVLIWSVGSYFGSSMSYSVVRKTRFHG